MCLYIDMIKYFFSRKKIVVKKEMKLL